MNFRNAIKLIFGGIKNFVTSAWKEIGVYTSRFSSFGIDIYANDVVRACIRALSEHTSKANCRVIRRTPDGIKYGDKALQTLIQLRPNYYMNGKDFLSKCRTLYEINNVLFIYIKRNEYGECDGLYPMPKAQYEALEVAGRLYIKFNFSNGMNMVHAWDDLAVLRKDYNTSDIWGDNNEAILTSLELLNITNQGMSNAIQSTANLRGIITHKKVGLSAEDVKKFNERFISDYMTMANTSGVASLDSNQEFTPIKLEPQIANYKSVEDLRLNIYRYFGINEDFIMSKYSPDVWQSIYESKIEPFLLALSLELTYKIYTDRQRGFGNEIIFESNRMQAMSMKDKLDLQRMVDRKSLTPNEWREVMNFAPLPGGDEPISWQNPKNINGSSEVDNNAS